MRIILLLGVFWANNLFAQKTLYQLDTIISFPFTSLSNPSVLTLHMKAVLDNDHVLYLAKVKENEMANTVYSLNINSGTLDTFPILNGHKYGIGKEYWLDMCLGQNGALFLLTDLNLYEFQRIGNLYKIARIHQYEGAYRYIGFLSPASLMLAEFYNHMPAELYKIRLTKYSLERGNTGDYFPQVNYSALTHIGRYTRVNSRNGKIYYIDMNAYQVYETDSDFSVVRTVIKEEKKGWKYLKPEDINNINALGSDGYGIIKYVEESKSKYSHINRISFINDTAMLIGYTNYDSKNNPLKYWDVWVSDGNANWSVKHAGIPDVARVHKKIKRDNYPLELVGNMVLANSAKLIRITYGSGLSALGQSKKEFEANVDKYYEKNSARLVFTVFNHSFVQ